MKDKKLNPMGEMWELVSMQFRDIDCSQGVREKQRGTQRYTHTDICCMAEKN